MSKRRTVEDDRGPPEDVLANFEWTDDCQGKKDYDGEIITLSTRYWPRGGGYDLFGVTTGRLQTAAGLATTVCADVKPSASTSICMFGDEIIMQHFEAETEDEVKALVEAWARQHITSLKALVKAWAQERKADALINGEK